MTTLDQVTLESIAQAVADELRLGASDDVSVSQVTVAVTYEIHKHDDDSWLEDWYERYSRESVPF